jgi:hypothetical protein
VPEAGVVDQDLDGTPARAQILFEPHAIPLVAKVGGDDLRLDVMVGGELGRQAAQPLLAPRHQDEREAARGELGRDRGPDPGRGAGDQRGIADGRFRQAHGTGRPG